MVAPFRLASAAGKLSALRYLRGQIPGTNSKWPDCFARTAVLARNLHLVYSEQ